MKMHKTNTPSHTATIDLNHLRRGHHYRATTRTGDATEGEYLGIEVAYDVWCVLIRSDSGTASIPMIELATVEAALQAA